MSIRTKLFILFLAITVIPVVFITSVGLINMRDTLAGLTLDNLAIIAESKEAEIFSYFDKLRTRTEDFASDGFIRRSMEEIQGLPEGTPGVIDELKRHLRDRKQTLDKDIFFIDVLDVHGRIAASTHPLRVGLDKSRETYFLNGLNRSYIKDAHPEPGGTIEIDVAAPLKALDDSGRTIGVLVNHFDVSFLRKMMSGEPVFRAGAKTRLGGLGKTGETYLVNQNKLMITDSLFAGGASFHLKVDTYPVKKCLEEDKEVRGIWRDYRGVQVAGASMCIAVDDFRWTLVSVQDVKEALVLVRDFKNLSLGLVVFVSVLAGMIAVATSRLIAQPILALQKGAEIIGGGNLDYKVGTDAEDEVGRLSRAFDRMTENLKKITASRDDLNKAQTEIKRKIQELARSNEELARFAYVASHDLQEPLRMVTSYVRLLEKRYKGRMDKDADDFIHFAVDGAVRMQKLIDDLLTYSRVGTKGKPLEPVESAKALQDALHNLDVVIREKGAVVTHLALPRVMADETQLVQLFQNLIGNAVKFCDQTSPRVHVAAERQGREWAFSVHDNGIGIDMRYEEKIFQVFQRLHPKDQYPGTGIGLAVCRKIVERHGGRMWVDSHPGHGSTFYFTLQEA